MKTWIRKIEWIRQHHYIILAAPDGSGWTATNEQTGLQIDFNETAMTVHNEEGNQVTGWREMDLQAFKLLTVSLGIVHLTAQERDEMQAVLNENYALQFLNHLS